MNTFKLSLKHSLCLIVILSLNACFDCQKFISKEFKPDYINGVIIRKYRDSNHDIPVLDIKQFKNQLEYILTVDLFPVDFWVHAQIGDTIHKKKGTTEVKLIKHDSTFSYYPECNCQPIK